MAAPRSKNGKFSKDRKGKRNTQSLLFRRKRFCRFTVTGVKEIDYKDIDTLRDFIAENGKIIAQAIEAVGEPAATVAGGTPLSNSDSASSSPVSSVGGGPSRSPKEVTTQFNHLEAV